ncbi:MAG: DegV family protein, partial [Kurthia sp.]|nr:DegV family protein [Kurthia sp.]
MKLFADSACDLPQSFYVDNNVHLFPLRVELDGKEFDDVIGIDVQKVYDEIRNGKSPKTSQVSP